MCGIAGIIAPPGENPTERVRAMIGALVHRGPDDEGIHTDGPLALGHRRLSIIDLAGGRQPLFNEDRSVAVVFNGEIYNFRTLRAQLLDQGHQFETGTDSECLVHLYEEYGVEMVHHLDGMFAFAIWDRRQQRLFLARDRLGIKPLLWRRDGQRFAFASELSALLAAGGQRELNHEALSSFFSLAYIPAPLSALRGCHKLPPGHRMVVDLNSREPVVERYWDLDAIEQSKVRTEQEALEALQPLVDNAVKARLVSDVPLGAFLSGGVDSSLVVASMASQTNGPVKTFSIGFEEARYNELPFADEVARALGTEHHSQVLRPDAVHLVEALMPFLDEPFGDSSAIPTYCVARMTREHVTVSLSGDGGDELFAGYTRYARQQIVDRLSKLPNPLLAMAQHACSALPTRPRVTSAYNAFRRARLTFPDNYATSLLFFADAEQKRRVLSPDLMRDESTLAHMRRLAGREGGVAGAQRLDAQLYLPDDILTKVDRMTMAVSLEARVPLLDHHVAEFAFSLPPALHTGSGQLKRLLKQLLIQRLPERLVYRKKQGFAVPLDEWFRGPLKPMLRDVLEDRTTRERGFFQPAGVAEIMAQHEQGHVDHSSLLWMLLVFELWMRQFKWSASENRG